jgi:hypothetical protein
MSFRCRRIMVGVAVGAFRPGINGIAHGELRTITRGLPAVFGPISGPGRPRAARSSTVGILLRYVRLRRGLDGLLTHRNAPMARTANLVSLFTISWSVAR